MSPLTPQRASLKGLCPEEEAVPICEPDVSLSAGSPTVQSPEESAPGDPVTCRLECDLAGVSEMGISDLESSPGEALPVPDKGH